MATKQAPKARILTRTSEFGIVFRGDSENRSPEADFGHPRAENRHFQNFDKVFAQTIFSTPFRELEGKREVSRPSPGQPKPNRGDRGDTLCENCPGGFCVRIAQKGL